MLVARYTLRIGWGTILILAILAGVMPGLAQSGDVEPQRTRYFSETGHTVAGYFLNAYESATDPELIFGYPITEAFQDQASDRIVQYFERARFELALENPPELRVVISPLGRLIYPKTPSRSTPSNLPGCRYIPETGVNLCYDFLDFYTTHGGAAQFGYPIADYDEVDGRIVQYFQRARFEYHPEQPPGERVRLTNLGKLYFSLMGENPIRLLSVTPPLDSVNALEPMVQNLRVQAFSEYAVMHPRGKQTIFVTIQDQRLMPVPGARVTLEITLPSGLTIIQDLPPSDKYGITKHTFDVRDEPLGMAKVVVHAEYSKLKQQTRINFRIWR